MQKKQLTIESREAIHDNISSMMQSCCRVSLLQESRLAAAWWGCSASYTLPRTKCAGEYGEGKDSNDIYTHLKRGRPQRGGRRGARCPER